MRPVNEEEFLDFIASVFEVERTAISLNTAYESIRQWDSLMQLRLVAELEEQYGVEIPIDEIPNITRLNDFFRYLQ